MTSRFSVLLASTALSLALGLPALATIHAQGSTASPCSDACAAVLSGDDLSLPLVRVSDDDDDDDDDRSDRRGHDDDDDDDDCDDDDCMGRGAQGNPAPAGTVAPPANGLFGTGAPPVAVTN